MAIDVGFKDIGFKYRLDPVLHHALGFALHNANGASCFVIVPVGDLVECVRREIIRPFLDAAIVNHVGVIDEKIFDQCTQGRVGNFGHYVFCGFSTFDSAHVYTPINSR